MGDKNLAHSKGKDVLVYDDHKVSQERIQNDDPPQVIRYPPELPIGFKFAPSEDDLVSFYLKSKIGNPRDFQPSFIPERNIYQYLPRELLEGNKDKDAYFFTPRNKIYANGTKVNRSVKEGYGHWRSTGKEKEIEGVDGSIAGYKNSLKFYIGKNKKDGEPTDWLMKEFVMKEKVGCSSSSSRTLDDWVICRVHLNKNTESTESTDEIDCGGNDGNSTTNTCNKKQKIEKQKKCRGGQAGIKIGDQENVRMSSDVPGPVHQQQYEDTFTSCNPQFGANNLAHSMMFSDAIPNIQHHHKNYYQFGGFSGMINQHYYQHQPHQQFEQQQKQPQQQFEQHQQQPHQQFEQHQEQLRQQFEQQQQQHYYNIENNIINNSYINSVHNGNYTNECENIDHKNGVD